MVELKDIRIDNYLLPAIQGSGNKPTKIGLDIINAWCDKKGILINWQPIPITPEILQKCGFGKRGLYHPEGTTFFLKVNNIEITTTDCYPYLWINNDLVNTNLLYVHQLQNIYYSLTGKELEVIL